ncbi:MAG: NADH-quinone oxidoreductase subunit J [Sinobacteraceae bacterium]|nr:NADH-quinone oxidoreductase subunit J [Nevskiaceae bacterium]
MLVEILFYLFGTILVLAALGVITSRNPVYSALALVLCFITSAAIWLLIEAEFLAVILVLVYVGAVMVLFLFVVMMLDINLEELRRGFTRYAWLGWLTALAVIVEIVGVVWVRGVGLDVTKTPTPTSVDYSNTFDLGNVMYTQYAYPFELAAVLLLVAIVAAISLTMRRRPGLKVQDIGMQVGVRARDRIRIIKMEPSRPVAAGTPEVAAEPVAAGQIAAHAAAAGTASTAAPGTPATTAAGTAPTAAAGASQPAAPGGAVPGTTGGKQP